MKDDPVTIATAVRTLVEQLHLSAEGEVLAAQAQALADHLDDGSIPPYATPAAHRELRALVEQLVAAPGVGSGVSDAELEALLRGEEVAGEL